jgi:hypothetical protein
MLVTANTVYALIYSHACTRVFKLLRLTGMEITSKDISYIIFYHEILINSSDFISFCLLIVTKRKRIGFYFNYLEWKLLCIGCRPFIIINSEYIVYMKISVRRTVMNTEWTISSYDDKKLRYLCFGSAKWVDVFVNGRSL